MSTDINSKDNSFAAQVIGKCPDKTAEFPIWKSAVENVFLVLNRSDLLKPKSAAGMLSRRQTISAGTATSSESEDDEDTKPIMPTDYGSAPSDASEE